MFMSTDFFSNLTIGGDDEGDLDVLANFNPDVMVGRKTSSLLFGNEPPANDVGSLERDFLRGLKPPGGVCLTFTANNQELHGRRGRNGIQSRTHVC
jgi:hypothetical protein